MLPVDFYSSYQERYGVIELWCWTNNYSVDFCLAVVACKGETKNKG